MYSCRSAQRCVRRRRQPDAGRIDCRASESLGRGVRIGRRPNKIHNFHRKRECRVYPGNAGKNERTSHACVSGEQNGHFHEVFGHKLSRRAFCLRR